MSSLKPPKYYIELIEKIRSIMDSINYGISLVIVEGKNDERALREFGLRTAVYKFRSSGLSEKEFIDDVAENFRGLSVVILLDFDDKGRRMADHISRELEERGVKVQHYFRRALKELLVKEGIRHLEEIRSFHNKATI